LHDVSSGLIRGAQSPFPGKIGERNPGSTLGRCGSHGRCVSRGLDLGFSAAHEDGCAAEGEATHDSLRCSQVKWSGGPTLRPRGRPGANDLVNVAVGLTPRFSGGTRSGPSAATGTYTPMNGCIPTGSSPAGRQMPFYLRPYGNALLELLGKRNDDAL